MVVFGKIAGEEAGRILYSNPDIDKCRNYANNLDKSMYNNLSICADNGIIVEDIVYQRMGYTFTSP